MVERRDDRASSIAAAGTAPPQPSTYAPSNDARTDSSSTHCSVEVDQWVRDARVRPVEVGQLAVDPGRVARMEVAVHECRRETDGIEAAARLLQLRGQARSPTSRRR